jgi:hypothetical protein
MLPVQLSLGTQLAHQTVNGAFTYRHALGLQCRGQLLDCQLTARSVGEMVQNAFTPRRMISGFLHVRSSLLILKFILENKNRGYSITNILICQHKNENIRLNDANKSTDACKKCRGILIFFAQNGILKEKTRKWIYEDHCKLSSQSR